MTGRTCGECGEQISAKRLAAVPSAQYCVGCQSSHDDPLVASESSGLYDWRPMKKSKVMTLPGVIGEAHYQEHLGWFYEYMREASY